MDNRTRNMLLLAGACIALPFAMQSMLEDPHHILAKDLTNIGLIGTLIGVPVGLVAIPRMSTLGAASLLTLLGLGVKFLLLPHHETHGEEALPAVA